MFGDTSELRSLDGTYRVRSANVDDAAAIARIYNQGIEDRVATFETEPRTTSDIERLLAARDGRYPTIVVESAGNVVAWASTGPTAHGRATTRLPNIRCMSTGRAGVPALGGWLSKDWSLRPSDSAC